MKVLFASAEVVPFVKTGGLADVASSLPKALKKLGVDIRVILPKYSDIPKEYKNKMEFIKSFNVRVGQKEEYCGILYLEYEGVSYYFIDNEYYFKRDGLYGFYDDGERFAYFNRAILETISLIEFKPDIIHCNDWHTGMVSPLLKAHYKYREEYSNIKTVFTIHNLKYQGIYPPEILDSLLNLGMEYYHVEALEFYGGVSFMKGGINYSDIITTVSKSYSKEIQTPDYGERLDGLLRKRKDDLYGIVNGIDYDIYNPDDDSHILNTYNVECIDEKYNNKLELQNLLGLPVDKEVPMIGMVSRLAHMKGIDLLLQILDELMQLDIQIVVLGTGETYYESVLREYSKKYPDKLSANILFDNSLAHKIYAAADVFLMPSLFEPCGLGQLIALRYGTLPIVRETGGLNDTVTSYNEFTGEGNGFSFTKYNAYDMLYTIKRALKFYHDKNIWCKLVEAAMNGDYSWKNSAKEYIKLYEKII
ncbi:glycogen synthase GlgA [Caldisalinibacter kiritimatiensis]|uniref:Glycogen synthase n=1 Tax=Caldisalinibacter kiritimatiensis TaxID=1304284 RepID=R1AVB9_9FIRM|nr:glycogen synthase GlgA [Caldisalinibacter kiritimatiensis]EOD00597.1 Glycogen synthase, ADP-glucose transglucosylase [Caldisalinibacter kiritimatiensis]